MNRMRASGVVFKNVTAEEGHALLRMNADNPQFVILDIRTPAEFSAGYIPGAVNIDYYAPDFQEKLNALDKDKIYFMYCRSGNRTGSALSVMKQLGFQEVYNLANGINSWLSAGYPLTQ